MPASKMGLEQFKFIMLLAFAKVMPFSYYGPPMLVPTSARVYGSNVGMLYLKILSANIGFNLLLKY